MQSEPCKKETFSNQQPANLQAEVCSYVLYNDNKYLDKRLIHGHLFNTTCIGEREKSHIGDPNEGKYCSRLSKMYLWLSW
jgi:hypothetical protein